MDCINCPEKEESKDKNANDLISMLKWNWFYVITISSLVSIGSSSPLGTLHQFLTNPRAETLKQFGQTKKLFEPGFGASEKIYAWSVSVNNIGGFLGGVCGGILASSIPYWYCFLIALLFHVIGFLIYGTAQHEWMVILARLLVGIFTGLQHTFVYAYFGVSYQRYVELLRSTGKKVNTMKYCRAKDILFSLYTITTSIGYFLGSGFSALLALFNGVDHFRTVGWYNFSLGILAILLQFVTFHGESKWSLSYRKQLKRKFRKGFDFVKITDISMILIIGFLLLCTAVVKSRTAVFELLLNPILSDSFGFNDAAISYFFLFVLIVPVFGGLMLFVLEWIKISNLSISIIGIIASIIGLAVMADWQAIKHDPCIEYSVFHNSKLQGANSSYFNNMVSSLPPPPLTCWNKSEFLDNEWLTDVSLRNSQLVLYYNPQQEINNDGELNCRVHVSLSSCYACRNSTQHSTPTEMYFNAVNNEMCYQPSPKADIQASVMKVSMVCDSVTSKGTSYCSSACLHLNDNSGELSIHSTSTKGPVLFLKNSYQKSLLLLQDQRYDAARNKCESISEHQCHWIPDSLVTHVRCRDCQPICRGLSHTLNFVQFLAGSIWFMFTFPVAEVALPVVISDTVQKEFQGILMGLTVALTEVFQSITPLWLIIAYDSSGRRTYLPMAILIATFLPFLLGLALLYRKLIRMRESQQNNSSDIGKEIYELVRQHPAE